MPNGIPSKRCGRRTLLPAIAFNLVAAILPGAFALVTPKFPAHVSRFRSVAVAPCQRHHQRYCRRDTALLNVGSPVVNGDTASVTATGSSVYDESAIQGDDFQPETQTIVASIAFFARYLVRTVQQERLTSRLTNRNKRRLLTKLRNSLRRKGWTADADTRRREDEATLARLKAELGFKDNEKELLDHYRNFTAGALIRACVYVYVRDPTKCC